jgi:acyl-CoA dehydrogenase
MPAGTSGNEGPRLLREGIMLLLNPRHHDRFYPDERSRQIMHKTIAWFEGRGLKKIKQDDYDRTWYADFLEFVRRERLFATPWTRSSFG